MSAYHAARHGATHSPVSPTTNGYVREPKAFIQRTRPYFDESMIHSVKPKQADHQVRGPATALVVAQWVWGISDQIGFPSRTRCCAMMLFHRLRLYYPEIDYPSVDLACACLFTACKIEDTLKKSCEILAQAYNIRQPGANHINSDSPLLEEQHKRVISIERQILEAISFDFRSRNHEKMLVKLGKHHQLSREVVAAAWQIVWDAYKTVAVVKMTPHELSLAGLMLAGRLLGAKVGMVEATAEEKEAGAVEFDYKKFGTTFADVLECVHDVLDLYTDHMNGTHAGPKFGADAFIQVRIELNMEAAKYGIPPNNNNKEFPVNHGVNGHSNSNHINGHSSFNADENLRGGSSNSGLSERGIQGTVRYVLSKDREELERMALQMEEEEEEEEYYNGGE